MAEPLFPPWSNSLLRWGLGALGCLVVGFPLLLMALVRSPWNTGQGRGWQQPIPFDHRHHVQDDGIDCRYCHFLVERSPSAGFPPTELCMNCHSQIWNETPTLALLRRSMEEGEPIRWKRVHTLPDFVFFDHSVHVNAGVDCASCHGDVGRMPLVRQASPLHMKWCLDCHRHPEEHGLPARVVTPPATPGSGAEERDPPRVLAPGLDCTTCHR